MPDVVLDSAFNWTPIQTGLQEMRAFANTQTRAIGRDIQGMFAGGIAVGAIVGGLRAIVDQAHEIHAVSEKFRLDAQELQTIGNAARDMGIPLETVARAMNLIEINAYKATQANNEQRKALEGLGIAAEDFYKLNSDQKILALADAYTNAGDKSAAYANIATIVGRRQTEMIRLIEQGSAAIKEQGNQSKFTAEQLASIERARVAWVEFYHDLQVFGANFFQYVVDPILEGVRAIQKFGAALEQGFTQIIHGNIVGGLQQVLTGTKPIAPQTIQPVTPPAEPGANAAARSAVEGGAGSVAGAGGSGNLSAAAQAKSYEELVVLAGKLHQIERDSAFERLSDGGKLEALQREQNALKAKELTQEGGTVDQAETLVAIGEKQGEIDKLSNKMAADQQQYNEQNAQIRQQMADKAQQELADSQELTKELGFQLQGRQDLADRARIEYDYASKIHDAENAAAEAAKKYAETGDEGFKAVEATNRALVAQLKLEEGAALAAHDKARAEEQAAKAAEEKASVDAEKENLSTLQDEARLQDLKLNKMHLAADQLRIELDYNKRIKDSLAQSNDLWTKSAVAYAQGNKALGDELGEHAQIKQQEAEELKLLEQQLIIAAQMLALEQAQKDTIAAGIQLDVQKGSIDSQTAQLEQQSVDLQYKSQDLQTRIDDAYATGNTLLAQQLEIQKQITDQTAEQARNAAFANQERTQGIVTGQPGTDALGRLAAGGGQFGATSNVYAAALAASQGLKPGSPAYDKLVRRIEAQDRLLELQGKNIGWEEQLNRDKLVQWFDNTQQQQSTARAAKMHADEMAYWGAIAAGRTPAANNPYTSYYGAAPGGLYGTTGINPAAVAAASAASLTTIATNTNTQTDLLKKIVDNTAIVHL